MSNMNKRVKNQSKSHRKNTGNIYCNLSKSASFQSVNYSPNDDSNFFNDSRIIYCFARYVMGNIVEVHTNEGKSVGVLNALSPDGSFGLTHVLNIIGCDDSNSNIVTEKLIPLSEIKMMVIRNVKVGDCLKVEPKNENHLFNDPENGKNTTEPQLQHYFPNLDDAKADTLDSDERFPPNEMFEVNHSKFQVESSYSENLEGYTVPLDKSDPDYEAKNEHFARVAKAIEEDQENRDWEKSCDPDLENDEAEYSAVFQSGVPGRDIHDYIGSRTLIAQSNYRWKSTTSDYSKCDSTDNCRQENAESIDSHINNVSDEICEAKHNVKDSLGYVDESSLSVKENCEELQKTDKKKNFVLDPDAPEFKPAGLPYQPLESLSAPSLHMPYSPFPVNHFQQPINCGNIPVSAFAIPGQSHLPNGSARFDLNTTLSYGVPSSLNPQLPAMLGIRAAIHTNYVPQTVNGQATFNLGNIGANCISKPGILSNLASGYSRQLPDHTIQVSQSIASMPTFATNLSFQQQQQQHNNFFTMLQSGSHPHLGMHLFSTSSNAPTQMYGNSSAAAMPNSVVSQASVANIGHGQLASMPFAQSNTQSPSQASSQLHQCFQSASGNLVNQTHVTGYPTQYPSAQSSAMSGAIGFYPHPLYHAPGLVQIPGTQNQISGHNMSVQTASQFQHTPQPVGIQPPVHFSAQPQIPTGLPIQHPQAQLLLANQQYQLHPNIYTQQILTQSPQMQAMIAMMASANQLPQPSMAGQANPVTLYMHQQNGGSN